MSTFSLNLPNWGSSLQSPYIRMYVVLNMHIEQFTTLVMCFFVVDEKIYIDQKILILDRWNEDEGHTNESTSAARTMWLLMRFLCSLPYRISSLYISIAKDNTPIIHPSRSCPNHNWNKMSSSSMSSPKINFGVINESCSVVCIETFNMINKSWWPLWNNTSITLSSTMERRKQWDRLRNQ